MIDIFVFFGTGAALVFVTAMFLLKPTFIPERQGTLNSVGALETAGRLVLGSLVRCRLGVDQEKGTR